MRALFSLLVCLPLLLGAQEAPQLESTVVKGKAENLLGEAQTSSQGQSSAKELQDRPFVRRGELLEVVPGLIVTQHSGGGKANQYFLRGFNLDHGTDFGIFVDGMPVNMRSHGHGQGYADVNFIIPELVERLDYAKGPYYAELGDFTTAGAARFNLYRVLPQGLASFTIGENDFYRSLIADSIVTAEGALTLALEYGYYDGPWARPDQLQRWNGLVRYSTGDEFDFTTVTFMGYDSMWNATDQVPQRAIKRGLIGRFDNLDNTVGGASHRYSLSVDHRSEDASGVTTASAYVGTYHLDLFSNFTLFLDDPVRGDQFNQFDDRWFSGANIQRTRNDLSLFDRPTELSFGAQTQQDLVNGLALRKTSATETLSTVRQDDVFESSLGAFAQAEVRWTDWMRTQTGLRGDLYAFDVNSSLAANSGTAWDTIVSPKLGLVLGPWKETEFYLNGGTGFHSNDARGVTTTIDPSSGAPVDPVPPLVRTYGAETGIRTQRIQNLTSTFSLWYLQSDSELVYVGDAGTNEPGDASERYGIEWSNYWRPNDILAVDTEFSVSDAYFIPTGEVVPNSVPVTFSGGVTLGGSSGPFGTLRARYFSPRPLSPDGSVVSKDAFQISARTGYRKGAWEVALEALNLLDARDNDIEYFYTSRLTGEPAVGVDDHHIHPVEPRQLRLSFIYKW
ncbi:MAG: TonB-dependent Receptor Plug Domain [Verrucomicrobia bacterium]|nr:MAG: TonB-dependent Receptor Plug Domain [Verrucomicrobiota bacterium]